MYSLLFAFVTLISDPPGLRSFIVTYKHMEITEDMKNKKTLSAAITTYCPSTITIEASGSEQIRNCIIVIAWVNHKIIVVKLLVYFPTIMNRVTIT